jgi:hypothetical protein
MRGHSSKKEVHSHKGASLTTIYMAANLGLSNALGLVLLKKE